ERTKKQSSDRRCVCSENSCPAGTRTRTAERWRAPVSGPNMTTRWSSPRSGTRSPRASRTSIVPDPRIRSIGAKLPPLPVEGHSLHGVEVDALEAPRVHHVVGRIGARPVERRNAAVAAEVMQRAPGTELIRRELGLSLNQAESVRGDHVVKVALAPADRAIALADARELGPDLELNAPAVAGAAVGVHRGPGRSLRTRIMIPLAHAILVATNSSRLSRSAIRDDTLGECPSSQDDCGRRSSTTYSPPTRSSESAVSTCVNLPGHVSAKMKSNAWGT